MKNATKSFLNIPLRYVIMAVQKIQNNINANIIRRKGEHNMATVFDVADYILKRKGNISAWKLQKLCYYAQAWHYTWTDHAIFPEQFQAWRNGPVCPELFHAHQGRYVVHCGDLCKGNANNLTSDEKDSIDKVLDFYGDREPGDLREQTHHEAPWRDARAGLSDEENCTNEITLESMGAYYGGL